MKKYFIETYGCQMNVAETDALKRELAERGWEEAAASDEADVALLNTCSVRKTAEDRIHGRIGYYSHLKGRIKRPKLVLFGCMAERLGEQIVREHPEIDLVIGNFVKHHTAEEMEKLIMEDTGHIVTAGNDEFRFSPLHSSEGKTHAYIPIMHGCDNYCTYCIVPYVRGREISRSPEAVVQEVKEAERQGIEEITLLGQNVNSYRFEYENGKVLNFPNLLELVLEESEDIPWIRFITSHPKDVAPELISLMSEEPRLCSHFHLPVQHGSNKILSAMNRRYRREDYLELVSSLRERVSDIALTTDILVGFPGETEEDFELLLDLIRRVEFDDAFMYYYNPREGTPAARFSDQIDDEIKHERLSRVIELQRSITVDKRQRRIGHTDMVMVDGVSKKSDDEMHGHTERDEPVVFPSEKELVGSILPVRLDELSGITYRGAVHERVENE